MHVLNTMSLNAVATILPPVIYTP